MSNSYFQFKKFIVHQDKCAMKVSTDACILGAWVSLPLHVHNVLDIGTGTGLLSLMLAQRYERIETDAIEIDDMACTQARENFEHSPWAERLRSLHGDINTYDIGKSYDLIICNPPFFNDSLQGPVKARNTARHTIHLTYSDLIASFEKYLNEHGEACVLLPSIEAEIFEELLLKRNWYIKAKLFIHPKVSYAANRVILTCTKDPFDKAATERLDIRNSDGVYTDRFKELMSPYYLAL